MTSEEVSALRRIIKNNWANPKSPEGMAQRISMIPTMLAQFSDALTMYLIDLNCEPMQTMQN